MNSNLVTVKQRHDYYNSLYSEIHPLADTEKRLYKKQQQSFDFFFKDNKLSYSKTKDIDFTKKSLDNFKSFREVDKSPEARTIQNDISFYLSNNLVPVKFKY